MPDSSSLKSVLNESRRIIVCTLATVVLSLMASCGGGGRDPCHCTPAASDTQDFRHAEKHVPLPAVPPTETTVAQILSWPLGPDPAGNAPRTGRELILYHIANAYLENARIVSSDCDFHLEISDVRDPSAARIIVETPNDSEYCPARQANQSGLAHHGFEIMAVDATQSELPQPLAVSVLGLAFRDFEHIRGSAQVATTWELHPAVVTLLE